MIQIDVINNNNKFEGKNAGNEGLGLKKMVRLPNLINRTIFRTRGISDEENDIVRKSFPSREPLNIDEKGDEKSPSINKRLGTEKKIGIEKQDLNVLEKEKRRENSNDEFGVKHKNIEDSNDMKMRDIPEKPNEKVLLDDKDFDKDFTGKSVEDLQDQIRSMKRSFLFEHNNLLEKCELEKFELRESYEEEKIRLRKAFENSKMELLKEIERKDKMLEKLAVVLKEQYQKDLESIKTEFERKESGKSVIIHDINQTVESIIVNNRTIIENNQMTFANLEEFTNLKKCQSRLTNLVEDLAFSSDKTLNESISTIEKDLILTRSVSAPVTAKVSKNTSEIRHQTSEPDLRQTMKSRGIDPDELINEDIQHEMAAVYRKQKADLVKLFNAEKEEDRKRLDQDKTRFEREVRTEYDSRMTVERKAWQDTIEDLEREIKILKYEREQLDRNYCLGMDEVRTEFEKEKQQIYKMYSGMYESKLHQFVEESETNDEN